MFFRSPAEHPQLSQDEAELASDAFGQHEVATATGLSSMFGYLGATVFSLMVGAMASTIGYNPLFVCLMLFDVIGAVVAWRLISNHHKDNQRVHAVDAALQPAHQVKA